MNLNDFKKKIRKLPDKELIKLRKQKATEEHQILEEVFRRLDK